MKGQKDIFDHIKDNQHKLDERPRRELWDQLENRLDQADQKAEPVRRNLYRRLSLVAAVVGLAGLFSLVSLLLNNNNNQNMATAESFAAPTQWETLSAEENEKGWHKYADFQRRINMRPSITEGAPHKKLVAQAHFAGRSKDTRFAHNTTSDTNRHSSVEPPSAPIAAAKIPVQENNTYSSYETAPEPVSEIQEEAPIAMAANDLAEDLESEKMEVVAEDAKTASKPVQSEKDAGIASSYAKEQAYASAKKKRSSAARKKQSEAVAKRKAMAEAKTKTEDAYDLNAASNAISYDGVDHIGVNQFQWLLGQWTANDQQASIESWKMTDEFTIEGKGFLVVNGDTTFTEGMTIQKLDQDLYYILALDQMGTTVQYKLKSYTEQEAIFENTSVSFPNQVVLRQNNRANYSITLQNTAPAQINEQQQSYFKNRNMIRKEQVKRVMKRMK